MEIIVDFLKTMQFLLLVKIALFLVIGFGLGAAGFVTRKWWLVAIGLVLALGQFVWPWVSNRSYENEIEARREYVQKLPKIPLTGNYPRLLVLEGDLSPVPPSWFIAVGYFDKVDFLGRRLAASQSAASCREAALAIHDPGNPRMPRRFGKNAHQWLEKCTEDTGPSTPDADALILRIDRKTTLYDRKQVRLRGIPRSIQLSLRRNKKEKLVHYDEIPTLAYPESATRLLPEGYYQACKQFNNLQIVSNILDAAMSPNQANSLMKRGSVRRSEYDSCIASIAPQIKVSD
ncbi:MAG: hypothetical protein U0S50_00755 [Sphingopyxis sp.]|uniref:hypothetical protein n=1 Tax=Sphingopyxis sp. TaxID=1908224 RepID=UPI002ABA9D44|nr:hypothetical protein [Sphingopyxis sp.]MDZ3830328.1 hypothetical protein [Sphingopyxis sp.]